jgi:hypothetical protein
MIEGSWTLIETPEFFSLLARDVTEPNWTRVGQLRTVGDTMKLCFPEDAWDVWCFSVQESLDQKLANKLVGKASEKYYKKAVTVAELKVFLGMWIHLSMTKSDVHKTLEDNMKQPTTQRFCVME